MRAFEAYSPIRQTAPERPQCAQSSVRDAPGNSDELVAHCSRRAFDRLTAETVVYLVTGRPMPNERPRGPRETDVDIEVGGVDA